MTIAEISLIITFWNICSLYKQLHKEEEEENVTDASGQLLRDDRESTTREMVWEEEFQR